MITRNGASALSRWMEVLTENALSAACWSRCAGGKRQFCFKGAGYDKSYSAIEICGVSIGSLLHSLIACMLFRLTICLATGIFYSTRCGRKIFHGNIGLIWLFSGGIVCGGLFWLFPLEVEMAFRRNGWRAFFLWGGISVLIREKQCNMIGMEPCYI